jgi:atlastin
MDIKPVKIISINNNDKGCRLIFHDEVFDKIVSNIDPLYYVSIITINGAYRSGKSFILNFIAKKFYNIEYDTYKFIHGQFLGTTGMWMLNKPIIMNNMAVLLIDTQGLFDSQLNIETTTTLFGLSTLISSIQIYNIDKRIQEDNLQHLALFSEYAKIVSKNNKKPFQHLNFLVRDWQHFDDINSYEKTLEQAKSYLQYILDREGKGKDLVDTRKHIINCYEKISCSLLPHPGYKVAEGEYLNNMSDIRDVFINHAEKYASELKDHITPKQILGRTIRLGEISTYIKKYVNILQNNDLPKPKTILSTTIEILLLNSIFYSLQYYQDRINNLVNNDNYIKAEQLELFHKKYKMETINFFKTKAIMGTDEDIKLAFSLLMKRIDKHYFECRRVNNIKKSNYTKYFWIIATFILVWIVKMITSGVCDLYICKYVYYWFNYIFYFYIFYFLISLAYNLATIM